MQIPENQTAQTDARTLTAFAAFSRFIDLFVTLVVMGYLAIVVFPWITELFHIAFGR